MIRSFTVGLDLGQGNDYSALVVVERVQFYEHEPSERLFGVEEPTEELHVRALRRWELGTPYPAVVDDVVTLMRAELKADALFVFDATGVGRAVSDLFSAEWLKEYFCLWGPIGLTVTAGAERHEWNYPKKDLIAALQVPLQQGRLKIADGLTLGPILEKELVGFRQKLSATGRESFDIQRRSGEGHGDLASALMLALAVPNTLRRPRVVVRDSDRGPAVDEEAEDAAE